MKKFAHFPLFSHSSLPILIVFAYHIMIDNNCTIEDVYINAIYYIVMVDIIYKSYYKIYEKVFLDVCLYTSLNSAVSSSSRVI